MDITKEYEKIYSEENVKKEKWGKKDIANNKRVLPY